MSRIVLLLILGSSLLPACKRPPETPQSSARPAEPPFFPNGTDPLRAGSSDLLPEGARHLGHEGDHYAVVTDHKEATRAAIHALEHGGNAVDAAIAAATTLGVVSPSASGLGGGGFALVFMQQEQSVRAFDFREAAGTHIDRDGWEKANRKGKYIGVPGEPLGLETLHRIYGARTLSEDVEIAAELAENGFEIGPYLRSILPMWEKKTGTISPEAGASEETLFRDESLRSRGAYYRSRVEPPRTPRVTTGRLTFEILETVARPALAKTLRRFGKEGSKPFYQGDIAHSLLRTTQLLGGHLGADDFASYKVLERAPLLAEDSLGNYRDQHHLPFAFRSVPRLTQNAGFTLATMPPPSAGGILLLSTHFSTGPQGLASRFFHAPSPIFTEFALGSWLLEATRARMQTLGDPDFLSVPYFRVPKNGFARKLLEDESVRGFEKNVGELPPEHGTTHILVRDGEGNVVSLTTTINSAFGLGVEDEATGILLNDELSDFTTTEQHKTWGLAGDPPNMFRPGARPVSSMTPTIVLWNSGTTIPECTQSADGKGTTCGNPVPSRSIAVAAIGGSGGMRISTGVTQVARCLFSPFRKSAPTLGGAAFLDGRSEFGGFSDPQACVDAPRFSVDWKGNLVRENLPSESDVTRKNIETAFAKMGVPLQPETFTTSAIHAIALSSRDASLGWFAAADKRKLGAGAAK